MLAVERILNAWADDHVRYRELPEYKSTKAVLQAIQKSLSKAVAQLRQLASTRRPTEDFLYSALEAKLQAGADGTPIWLETSVSNMVALQVAADELLASLKDVYGQSGGSGPPTAVQLDQFIERMLCLFEKLGGDTALSWRPVKADNATDDEVADVNSAGKRAGPIVDLLQAIIAVVRTNEDRFPDGLADDGKRLGPALGQRVFRVITAWQSATASDQTIRRNEIRHFLMLDEARAAWQMEKRRARHAKKLKAARKKMELPDQLSTDRSMSEPPDGVAYLDEGRPSPPMTAHATKKERANANPVKPSRRRPKRPTGTQRTKPTHR